MIHDLETHRLEEFEILKAIDLASKVIANSEGACPEEVVLFGTMSQKIRNFISDHRKSRLAGENGTTVVYLRMDDPLRPAGILLANTDNEVLVYQLLKQVRITINTRKIFGTPRMYQVIDEIFTDEGVKYRIIEAGYYKEMEFVIS